jgi:hypothetical protein
MNPQQHGANEPEAPLMRFQRFAAGLQLLVALMASVVLPMVSVFFFHLPPFFSGKRIVDAVCFTQTEKMTVGWFVLREKYCWLVVDKPNEQAARFFHC